MKDIVLVLFIISITAIVLGTMILPEDITVLHKYWEYSVEDSLGNCFVTSGEESVVHVNIQESSTWNNCKNPMGLIFYVTYKDAAGKVLTVAVKPDLWLQLEGKQTVGVSLLGTIRNVQGN